MIYVTGDTHIPIDISKLNSKQFPIQKELSKNDFLIICGDFGGVWNNGSEEMYWRKWLDNKNFTTLFIDGNHENFDLLNGFEVVDFYGGKAHKIANHIYHLMRGQVYKIENKTFFTLGGASSSDKEYRIIGKSWWKEELPTAEELETAIASLESVNWKVDYILTHCAPLSILQKIFPESKADVLNIFLEDVKNRTTFKEWYFGHYHIDKTFDDNYFCLYDTIKQL